MCSIAYTRDKFIKLFPMAGVVGKNIEAPELQDESFLQFNSSFHKIFDGLTHFINERENITEGDETDLFNQIMMSDYS